jgi:trimeric autotransporter adhesin
MSTKTLRKRIALTAVTALGAGLLSVVSTPAANAWGTTGVINVRTANAATGVAVAHETIGSAFSVGVITADTTTALASTATMLASGTIVVAAASDTTERMFSVVGGLIVGAGANVTVQTGSTLATTNTTATAKSIAVRPNAGVAQMTISLTAGTIASPGDLVSRLVVTVVAASAGGIYSAADSSVNTAVVGSSVVDGIDQANVITGSASRIPNGAQGKINFSLKDAYGTALTASVLTATASTGGFVKLSANDVFSATSGGTASVDVGTMRAGSVTVTQAVANAPATVTVTIAYKGVTVGTKTFNFEGEVAKVTVTPTKVAKTTVSSNTDAATIVYNDAAGNVLYPQNAVATTVVTASMGDQTIVNGVTVANYPTAAPVSGKVTISCNATSGTVPALQVRHLNAASGTIVLSNTWAQTCAGAAANLTASWDKASYTPGSIATLTLTFKDAKGFAANSYDLLDTMTITGSPSSTTASAGAAITPLNASAARGGGTTGTVTQQYVVGSTTGDFVAVVVPAASLVTASGNTQANLSVAYKIASSSATVTNEQVLASIVSLIASINKQIVALQKLILQRR